MNKQELFENIKRKKSFLCVGLDTDIKKIPEHLLDEEDPVFAFNKAIIDATAPYCIAYKPNLAFYEHLGMKGWMAFEKTVNTSNCNIPTSSSSQTPNVATSATRQPCMPALSSASWTSTL